MSLHVDWFLCKTCGVSTPHVEDTVATGKHATVWHCLICGSLHEPPDQDTDYHTPAKPKNPIKPDSHDIRKVLV